MHTAAERVVKVRTHRFGMRPHVANSGCGQVLFAEKLGKTQLGTLVERDFFHGHVEGDADFQRGIVSGLGFQIRGQQRYIQAPAESYGFNCARVNVG